GGAQRGPVTCPSGRHVISKSSEAVMEREQLVYGFLPASLAIPARESVRKSVGTAPAGNDPLEALRGTFGTEVPTADVVNAAWEQVYERLFAARGYPSDARARAAVAQDTDAML